MTKVKAIQSFVPFNAGLNPEAVLGKPYTYLALLSSLQLEKLYGEVTLYTNNSIASFLKQMDFPYKYDTSLEGETGIYFAMPKLKAFMKQTDPFVHFDLDTLVFNKPGLFERTSPYLFSHRDMPNHGFTKKDRRFPRKKHEAVSAMVSDVWFDNLVESYLLAYYNCQALPEDYPTHLINPQNIPNMNYIGVKNVETFKKATAIAMDIADNNKKIFRYNWLASNFIEQLTIPLYLEFLDEDYRKALKATKAIDSPYSFSGDPFTCTGFPKDEPQWQDKIPEFPFSFKHHYQCGECSDWHNQIIEIKNKKDLTSNLDLSKYKYVHIGGGNKKYALWQAMIIHTLVENFGEEPVLKVTELYRVKDQDKNIKLKFLPGEMLYEELTGNKLFTETYQKSLKLSLI